MFFLDIVDKIITDSFTVKYTHLCGKTNTVCRPSGACTVVFPRLSF